MDWAKNVILDKFSSLFSFFKLKMGNRWIQRHWPEIQELSYIMKVREGDGTLLQYSRLENTMDGGAWWAAVHGITKSPTRLSDFTFTFHFHDWRRKWQPTLVFLPGESQGRRSLLGCCLCVCVCVCVCVCGWVGVECLTSSIWLPSLV